MTDDTSLALFTLKYQCPKDVFQEVQKKLDDIRKVTKVHRVNLKSELKSYSGELFYRFAIIVIPIALHPTEKRRGNFETLSPALKKIKKVIK